MAYHAMLARSFSRYDQRKLGYGALVACLLIALSFCTVLKPYLGPLPVCKLTPFCSFTISSAFIRDSTMSSFCSIFAVNLKLSVGIGHKLFATQEEEGPTNQWEIENRKSQIVPNGILLCIFFQLLN